MKVRGEPFSPDDRRLFDEITDVVAEELFARIAVRDRFETREDAKRVEASVAPNGRPLAVCVGSSKREQEAVYFCGRLEEWPMFGYIGCLRTFPDPSFGPGRRWPRLCPRCRQRRTNHRNAARAALRRRAVEPTDAINSRT